MTMRPLPLAYIAAHWRGHHTFGWSFWVNLVALRAALSTAQSLVFTGWTQTHDPVQTPQVALMMLTNALILVWQVVGVIRASDTWLRDRGSISNTWGAQLGIVIAAMLVMADTWGLWILTIPVQDTAALSALQIAQRASLYAITLSENGSEIRLTGSIEPGITKALAAFITQNPGVQTLTLTSNGGNIFEARGLAKLVSDAHLNTRIATLCNSACTIAFIAGKSRQLSAQAQMGFHQYQINPRFGTPLVHPRAEETRDRATFQAEGVADWFLDRAYSAPPNAMWFPSHGQMLRAGVITDGG